MIKTKIVETTEWYDAEGRITKTLTREEQSIDDNPSYPATMVTTTSYQTDGAETQSD